MSNPLKPLNQSARVVGNASSSLLLSAVGNCFPGLEFDVRTLDRRFFPGLVFDFNGSLEAGPDGTQGAVLVQLESYDDPMLDGDEPWQVALNAAFNGDAGNALGDGTWYLHALTQDGVRIEMYEFLDWQNSVTHVPYEGEIVWWLIRGLRAGSPVVAELSQRGADGRPTGLPVVLTGQRRRFVNEDGIFDRIYRPGELTASMCSPWTHDFRDCTCHYWASNHPDVVMGAVTGPSLPDGESARDRAQSVTFLDWMRRRSEPAGDVSAATTIDEARKHRYDPYEINHHWQDLAFVLEGRELAGSYEAQPPEPDKLAFRNPAELIDALTTDLAPLEMVLIFEYLYAMFSLKAPDEVDAARFPDLPGVLSAARQLMILTAISEMTHLRWANQILWSLSDAGLYPPGRAYAPVVHPAREVAVPPLPGERNTGETLRPRALRRLTPEVLAEFVFVERPTGDVDAEYEAVVRELKKTDQGYPPALYEIAVRIDTDGMKHYERFRDIQRLLAPYVSLGEETYLRTMRVADPSETKKALRIVDGMVKSLAEAYVAEAAGELKQAEAKVILVRRKMDELNRECEDLAKKGLGVDFFALFQTTDA